MTAFPTYSTGTVAIATNATSVVGTGSNWTGQNAMAGDTLAVAGFGPVKISDVTDALHLVIDAWPYAAVTAGTAYSIKKDSPLRFAGGQAMADVSTLVGALNTDGFFVFVPPGAAVPDPSYGDDGQYAFKPSTGSYWLKTGGVWVPSSPPAAGYGGTSTTSFAIGTGSKAFTTQAGFAYQAGTRIRVVSAANTANYMEGQVTSYSGPTLTVNVTRVAGTGTHADWNFSVAGDPGSGDMLSTNNGSDFADEPTVRANIGIIVQNMARLTLTSGVAVTQADVAGATSIFVTPAAHNMATIYDGTKDWTRVYSEITITLDTTNALAGKNYDGFFAFSGGVVVAGYGPAWSSDTSRGTGAGTTEIEAFNGRLVNKNAITLRSSSGTTYSIVARQATLVGSFRASANGMTEDSVLNRLVWNVVTAPRIGKVTETADSWAYSTATFRQVNGNTANQFTYLDGGGNVLLKAQNLNIASNSTASFAGTYSGIGIDSTSVNSATITAPASVDSNASRPSIAIYSGCPGVGFHKIVPLERGNGSIDTQTFIGDAGAPSVFQSGMTVDILL